MKECQCSQILFTMVGRISSHHNKWKWRNKNNQVGKGKCGKGYKETFRCSGIVDIVTILYVVTISHIKTYQGIQIKYIVFLVCQFHISKAAEKHWDNNWCPLDWQEVRQLDKANFVLNWEHSNSQVLLFPGAETGSSLFNKMHMLPVTPQLFCSIHIPNKSHIKHRREQG